MAQRFLTPIDLTKNELLNAAIQNLAAAPSAPAEAQVWYSTVDKTVYFWNGTAWDSFILTSEEADLLDRANHTGTQAASTISDFDTQVRTSRLDQMATPTASVSLNNQRITNLLDPSGAQDAATKAYVDALVNGVAIHPSVRAATTGNITLSGEQTIDGVSVVAGDRVLVKNQDSSAQNGIYVAAAGAWARAADADTWEKIVSGFVFVEEGSVNGDTAWVSTGDQGGTIGTTAMPWTQFAAPGSVTGDNLGTGVGVFDGKVGSELQFRSLLAGSDKVTVTLDDADIVIDVDESEIDLDDIGGTLAISKGGTGQTTAAGALAALGGTRKHAATIGNNSATSFGIEHNFDTTDVLVAVKEVASPFEVVYPDVRITDANNVTVIFSVAPTTNQYRVIVIG